MTRAHELRNVIFKEIIKQGGIIIDAAPTRGGHHQVRCSIAGEAMKFTYSASPSDWRAVKTARGYVRRQAKSARRRMEQERRGKLNGRSEGATI
jgi:hypothetical protein